MREGAKDMNDNSKGPTVAGDDLFRIIGEQHVMIGVLTKELAQATAERDTLKARISELEKQSTVSKKDSGDGRTTNPTVSH